MLRIITQTLRSRIILEKGSFKKKETGKNLFVPFHKKYFLDPKTVIQIKKTKKRRGGDKP